MSSQIHEQSQSASDRAEAAGVEISLEALDAAGSRFNATAPIVMLNLLRFHQTAVYPANSDQSRTAPPISGREVYLTRYLPAFQTIAPKICHGSETITPLFIGAPTHSLVTQESVAIDIHKGSNHNRTSHDGEDEGEKWDMIGLISYPNFEIFRTLITCPEYLETAQPHRLASLKDWRLIATTPWQP